MTIPFGGCENIYNTDHSNFVFFPLSSAADCSRLRLAAACGIIKIAQEPNYIECISLENFQRLSLVMQVRCYERALNCMYQAFCYYFVYFVHKVNFLYVA